MKNFGHLLPEDKRVRFVQQQQTGNTESALNALNLAQSSTQHNQEAEQLQQFYEQLVLCHRASTSGSSSSVHQQHYKKQENLVGFYRRTFQRLIKN